MLPSDFHRRKDLMEAQRPGFALVETMSTADERGEVFRFADTRPPPGRSNSVVVVVAGGEEHELELETKDTLRPTANLDVVLVGDWPTR